MFGDDVDDDAGLTTENGSQNNGKPGYYARVLMNGRPYMMGGFFTEDIETIQEFTEEMSPVEVIQEIIRHHSEEKYE